MSKLKSRFESTGFQANLVNLVILAFGALGVTTQLSGEETLAVIIEKNWEMIFSFVIPSVVAAGFKVMDAIQKKVDLWKTISKSPNFWNLTITTVLSLITMFVPIVFPADAGTALYSAFEGMQLFTIVTVIASNLVTPILYYLRDRKKALASG